MHRRTNDETDLNTINDSNETQWENENNKGRNVNKVLTKLEYNDGACVCVCVCEKGALAQIVYFTDFVCSHCSGLSGDFIAIC